MQFKKPIALYDTCKIQLSCETYIIFTMRLYLARKYFQDVILRMS